MAAYHCWNSTAPVDQVQRCKRQHEYAFSVQEDVDLESVNPKRACQGLLSLYDPDETSMDTDIQPVAWDNQPSNQVENQPNIDCGNPRPDPTALDANQNGANAPVAIEQDGAVAMEESPTPKQTPSHRFFISGGHYLSPVLQSPTPQQACGISIGEMTHPCKMSPLPRVVGNPNGSPSFNPRCLRCTAGEGGHFTHIDVYPWEPY